MKKGLDIVAITCETFNNLRLQTEIIECSQACGEAIGWGAPPLRLGAFLAGKANEEWGLSGGVIPLKDWVAVWQGKALRGLLPA